MFAISKRYNERYIGNNGKKTYLNFIIGIFILEPKLSKIVVRV